MSDAEIIDWLERHLFARHWDGVIEKRRPLPVYMTGVVYARV
jgi:hypothetical protein